MSQRWCTDEDVLKDLEEVASGQKVAPIDTNAFLYGGKKPAPHVLDAEEEDIELQFGQAASSDMLEQSDMRPDLPGITQMLRMVQQYEELPGEEPTISPNKRIILCKANYSNVSSTTIKKRILNDKEGRSKKIDNLPNTTLATKCDPRENIQLKGNIVITKIDKETKASSVLPVTINIKSKLNPNVQEFVPRSSGGTKPSLTCSSKCTDLYCVLDHTKSIEKNSDAQRTKEQKKEMATLLKQQINDKNETYTQQCKTNAAIGKLLKLYAEPKKPIKLLTPEYFVKSHREEEAIQIESPITETSKSSQTNDGKNSTFMTKEHTARPPCLVSSHRGHKTPRVDDKEHITTNCMANELVDIDQHEDITQLTPDVAEFDISKNNVTANVEEQLDPEVEESINKVNNWLDNKPLVTVSDEVKMTFRNKKTLGPVLNYSTVTYKRKDPVTSKSPSVVTSKKIPKPLDEYKPSTYAEELHKKYTEHSEAASPTPIYTNIWEKLEADLKKKDLEIKRRNKKA